MRATVLCVLAIAGATCALQIPSLPSPQSMLGAGSSMLNNVPQINQRADDSSSSSSSSEEDNTPQIATELANRLVQDVMKAAEGAGSLALLPLRAGTSLFNTIADDIKDFMGNVLNMGNVVTDSNVPALAVDLAKSVVRDVERLALDAGALVLEPAKFKVRLVKTIAGDVAQWLKKIQGEASQHHNRPTEQPRPTPPKGHRPTRPHRPSSPRPRPTPSLPPTPARPTTPERPSSPRPRPIPSLPPTSSRPRPTTTERPSSPRPRPTSSEGPGTIPSEGTSSQRPSATTPRGTSPTPSERPSSQRPSSTTSRQTGPTTSAPATSPRPGSTTSRQTTPTTSAPTTSPRPSTTTSAPTTSPQPSSTTSTPSSTQQTSTIRDSSDEDSPGIEGSLKLGRAVSVSGSIHSDIPAAMRNMLG